jgi:NAD(P)H dehydrogenase (quinone)
MKKIAVSGATGRLGVKVVTRLAELGIKQRLIVRDSTRVPDLPGAKVAYASYSDAIAMERAHKGVETLSQI